VSLARRVRALEEDAGPDAGAGDPPLWEPLPDRPDGTPSPQRAAYESAADVLGFGGSAGGSKSDLLLGLALTSHRRSVVFRREAAQLAALIDRSREILGGRGRFNANSGVWRELPGGRQLEFGGVKDLGDEQRHRGRPHDFIGFDEADQFLEFQVRFLTGWLRTTTPGQRCRVVICFNPPASADGRWLLEFFKPWLAHLFPDRFAHPNPAAPGELRWYATLPDGREVEREGPEPFDEAGETITPKSRAFIPSRVQDNPKLMATGYVAQLQSLPEPLRSQLLHGDMAAGLKDDPWQVVPTEWVRAAQARWRPEGSGVHVKMTALGLDVAYGGDDKTVLAPRYRTWFAPLLKYPGRSTPDGPATAGLALACLREAESLRTAEVNVDAIGYGASAYDFLKDRIRANAVVFSERCPWTDRTGVLSFTNLRAYAYWSLREALDPRTGDGLALPPDPELLADLTAARWEMRAGGVAVEAKERVKERIGRSPDCGDAVVLAHLQTGYGDDQPAWAGRRGG
jgi:hypothetical protein